MYGELHFRVSNIKIKYIEKFLVVKVSLLLSKVFYMHSSWPVQIISLRWGQYISVKRAMKYGARFASWLWLMIYPTSWLRFESSKNKWIKGWNQADFQASKRVARHQG